MDSHIPSSNAGTVFRETSYEELPYASQAFAETHPDHLASLARLYGLTPPPVERCRVLELGCAAGGNLIPMAVSLPGSHCVGVDLSRRQIAEGQATVAALGLRNVSLEVLSLADIGSSFGKFDFIVAHGIYSWVEEALREKILAICSQNLSPDGIAVVSYNTHPGWRARSMVREMMAYHIRREVDPEMRAKGRGTSSKNSLARFPTRAIPMRIRSASSWSTCDRRRTHTCCTTTLKRSTIPCISTSFSLRPWPMGCVASGTRISGRWPLASRLRCKRSWIVGLRTRSSATNTSTSFATGSSEGRCYVLIGRT